MRVGFAVALNDIQDLCCNHTIATLLSFHLCIGHERHTMRKDPKRPQRSSYETVDLWEHACLLYQSYEWQSAADAFSELEQHAVDLEDKCVFALNKGLIEARLGDLDIASVSFTTALEYDQGDPVAHFLLGLTHAESRNYAKAKTHFEHCLDGLSTAVRDYRTHVGSLSLSAIMIQENIDHMRSRLIATAAGHGRTSHLRTRLHILPAEVLFEPPSRSIHTSQRDSTSSREQIPNAKIYGYSDERLQDPVSRPMQPSHVAGHNVNSMYLVEDDEKNLTIEPTTGTGDDVRRHKRLAPRDPRARNSSIQELARFLRHAGPSGDANVTVDRKYMQSLLQVNTHDRKLSRAPFLHQEDEFESLLGLYTGSPTTRRSIPTTIASSISDATTTRQIATPGYPASEADERRVLDRNRPLGSRRPTFGSAQRRLRDEVRPLGLYMLPANDQYSDDARAARNRSRGAMSSDERDGQSLPSVVSSTEMFTIGRPRISLRE